MKRGLRNGVAPHPGVFAGMPGAQATARQGGATVPVAANPGFASGMEARLAETAPLAPFTTARPPWGRPEKA
ncbi:hypothetical protein [Escherichia coli]|uniref:hypothetical protein n=1 Tax=Escherichia coli TaxID=562 RepID=UPI003EB9E757